MKIHLSHKIIVAGLAIVIGHISAKAQVPTFQDCLGAIKLCTDTVEINFNHNGMGNYPNEIATPTACYAGEQRSVWITFTVQQAGALRFAITPTSANQDHDWTLFNLTNATCASLSTSAGSAAAMARSNTWGVFGANGPTGISTPNGGTGVCNGPGTGNGPQWCADLAVTAGETYALHISNWTGSVYGFICDFSASTAVLYDSIPPQMDTITSSTGCNSFNQLTVQFSEPIACSSVQTGDFALIGPGGSMHTVTAFSSTGCAGGAPYSNTYTFTFSPAVTQVGSYKFKIMPGFGYVEDACGNLDVSDSLEFEYSGGVDFTMSSTNPVCYGVCSGTIQTTITEGTPPFTYVWSGGLGTGASKTNVCAGTYTVTVTDLAGCTKSHNVTITQPADIVPSIISSYNVSCPGSTNCDGGATVGVTGGTQPYFYVWSSSEFSQTALNLCAGQNSVTVSDANGCSDSISVYIDVPQAIVTNGFGDTLICISNIAAVAAASSGGTPPFTYIWTKDSLNGPVVGLQSTLTFTPQETTQYFVTSTDSRGCAGDTALVTVRVRPPLGLDIPRHDTICPGDSSWLTVQGVGGDSNYTYAWSNGQFGPSSLVYPEVSSWFYVTVSDLCGTPPYADSAFQQVGGYSSIKADIKVEDDTLCLGESIYLIAKGAGGHGGPDEYRFKWAHTSDTNRIQFVAPGKTTAYLVTITDLCYSPAGYDTVTVHVGKTELPRVTFTPEEACARNDVSILLNPRVGYTYLWDMGDGWVQEFLLDTVIRYQFIDTGCHDISVQVTSDFGCVDSAWYPCAVRVLEQPVANFRNVPEVPTNINPVLLFENTSGGAATWVWNIEHTEIENQQLVSHTFNEFNDYYIVSLAVRSDDGCTDTIVKTLPFERETVFYYPSSFTPNGDGLNDCFSILNDGLPFDGFDLEIFDRWGHQVFRTINPDQCWDGKNHLGEAMPSGSYAFKLHYRDHHGISKVLGDHVIISVTGEKTELR